MRPGSHHDPASRAVISAGRQRRDDYREAAAAARALIYVGADVETTRLAVGEALALAPDEMKLTWEKYAAALAAGRRIKVASYPVTFILPPSDELVAEVEAIFGAGPTSDPE